jgi:predicted glycosyltransferase
MDPKAEKKIDEIMYETNEKVSAIVNEIRDIRFSKMDENEKQAKCDSLREQFERVMLEEEKKVEKVMEEYP